MSIIDAAFKQTQTAAQAEQAHLVQKQQQQLALYRRVAIGSLSALVCTIVGVAGFYTGQQIQGTNSEQQNTVAQLPEKRVDQQEPDVQTQVKEQPYPAEANKDSGAAVVQAVQQASPQVVQPQAVPVQTVQTMPVQPVQYQWMTVQVGSDAQGQPVYTQQLVPITANVQAPVITTQPHVTANRVFSQPSTVPAQTSNVIQDNRSNSATEQEDLSKYRVFGELPEQYKNAQSTQNQEAGYSTAEISPELKEAFAKAVVETEPDEQESRDDDYIIESDNSVTVEFLPQEVQAALPVIRYQAHIYATSADKRWIKVNNAELYEGQDVSGITLLEITPEKSRFLFQGHEFTLEAMQDWLP